MAVMEKIDHLTDGGSAGGEASDEFRRMPIGEITDVLLQQLVEQSAPRHGRDMAEIIIAWQRVECRTADAQSARYDFLLPKQCCLTNRHLVFDQWEQSRLCRKHVAWSYRQSL